MARQLSTTLEPNRRVRGRHVIVAMLTAVATAGMLGVVPGGLVAPAAAAGAPYQDPALSPEARLADLLPRMTLDEKIGQMTQAEWRNSAGQTFVEPAQMRTVGIGSLLNGGGVSLSPNTAQTWADMYDAYQREAMASRLGIPMIYGVDAVHGHNNLQDATIFPHNIGLGATRDPGLVQRIGRATAEEVAGTGPTWDFAPCLCVARDDRWGRTYESFGETPAIVSPMASLITGLQTGSLSNKGAVLATAKHFIGDGGTGWNPSGSPYPMDQGNTQLSEANLRAIHLPPFREAIRRDVATVMVSYSSWNGVKMHAHRYLITDVLKGELGFDGFVVSDWAAIDQIDGVNTSFTAAEVTAAINAGVDMVMVPHSWQQFIDYAKAEVQAGRIPMSRIDDAVSRILLKKFESGLFERPYADRSLAGTIGSQAHRDLAREAVRKSAVLLKNTYNRVLPLPRSASKIFVAGKSADNIGYQSGGWTITWQGGDGNTTAGTTILQGIRETVYPGSEVTYDRWGNGIDGSYNAAIVVVGEKPYAEGIGDDPDLTLDQEARDTIARLKGAGVPVVVVLVSGRPMNISAEIAKWDAAVAAWLPGSEGKGVAEVLFGQYPFTGKLPMTWPVNDAQQPINAGDGKVGLFPLGHGLTTNTTQDAYNYIGSAFFDDQSGTYLERCTDAGCGQNVGHIARGDRLGYFDVDFGTTPSATVETRIASGSATSGTIEYRLGWTDGPVIARVPVSHTGGWQNWQTVRIPTTGVTGKQRVYQTFISASGDDFVNINWFRFHRG